MSLTLGYTSSLLVNIAGANFPAEAEFLAEVKDYKPEHTQWHGRLIEESDYAALDPKDPLMLYVVIPDEP